MVRNTLSMIIAAITSIVLFTAGTTVAQVGGEYGGQTEQGGQTEMDTSKGLSFDSLDMDGDDQITREEFITGMYEAWDKDTNDTIDQEEWSNAVEKYGISEQYAQIPNPEGVDRQAFMDWSEQAGLYEKWDTDGDGVITEQEFDTAKEEMKRGSAETEEGGMEPDTGTGEMGPEEGDGGLLQ